MKEEQVRQIVREEMEKNYRAGNTKVPPHQHNRVDNLGVDAKYVTGFQSLTNQNDGVISLNNTSGANFIQSFQGSNVVYPIPLIVGGTNGAFNRGVAVDGMILGIFTGPLAGYQLAIYFDGTWYGTTLTAL